MCEGEAQIAASINDLGSVECDRVARRNLNNRAESASLGPATNFQLTSATADCRWDNEKIEGNRQQPNFTDLLFMGADEDGLQMLSNLL